MLSSELEYMSKYMRYLRCIGEEPEVPKHLREHDMSYIARNLRSRAKCLVRAVVEQKIQERG